jgi:hypothetical protein
VKGKAAINGRVAERVLTEAQAQALSSATSLTSALEVLVHAAKVDMARSDARGGEGVGSSAGQQEGAGGVAVVFKVVDREESCTWKVMEVIGDLEASVIEANKIIVTSRRPLPGVIGRGDLWAWRIDEDDVGRVEITATRDHGRLDGGEGRGGGRVDGSHGVDAGGGRARIGGVGESERAAPPSVGAADDVDIVQAAWSQDGEAGKVVDAVAEGVRRVGDGMPSSSISGRVPSGTEVDVVRARQEMEMIRCSEMFETMYVVAGRGMRARRPDPNSLRVHRLCAGDATRELREWSPSAPPLAPSCRLERSPSPSGSKCRGIMW